MIGRIVEIASEGRYLSVDRGFLSVAHAGEVVGTVPLDDIAALICNAHGLSYSNNLLVALATRGVPIILCGNNHAPAGVVWGVDTHHVQSRRLDLQIGVAKGRRHQIWKQIVQSKLLMQAAALRLCGKPHAPLTALVRKVQAGDKGNIEGQGARAYWTLLFGGSFRRDRDEPGVNALLNYGYAVLRSIVARRVMGCGLTPGIGIYHTNAGNPMRLVDDLMEPFRSVVDVFVWRLLQDGVVEVTPDAKRTLGSLPTRTLRTDAGLSPLTVVAERLCHSFVGALEGGKLALPHSRVDVLLSLWDEADDPTQETFSHP
jgi:CRISPR-associated protein Cas1